MKIKYYLFFLILTTGLSAQPKESSEILARIDAYRVPFKQLLVRTKISSFENDQLKETAIFDAYFNGTEKSLVIAREYKTKGMKLLYVGEDMWIHLPDSRRPIRITPIQRLLGEASNGDVARISFGDDYTAEVLGAATIEAVACHKINLVAKRKSATYHRIVLLVRQTDFRPVKAEYYVISGKHIKTAFFDTYQMINGKQILKKMTIYDELNKSQKTVFEYQKIQSKEIPVKYFNKNYLIYVSDL